MGEEGRDSLNDSLRVNGERSGKREGFEGKGGRERALGREWEEEKNEWGRGK